MLPGALLLVAPLAQTPDSYTVHLTGLDAARIEVRASLDLVDGFLRPGVGGGFDRDGWAAWVADIEARADGASLSVETRGAGGDFHWLLTAAGGPYSGQVELTYTVDLAPARRAWDFGNEQVGAIVGEALYTVTQPLFLATTREGPRRVHLDVPGDWSTAVPWHPAGDTPRTYEVADLDALQRNSLVLGRLEPACFRAGRFAFTVVAPGAPADAQQSLAEAVRALVPLYLRLFPETRPGPYLLTVLPAAGEDAEAFASSAAVSTALEITAETRLLWANFVAHELFHYWNGQRLRGTPRADRQFFSEGFTEYYANLALINAGLIDEPAFVRKTEQHLARAMLFSTSPAFAGVTLRQAGADKGRNRPGVYDGGWTAAFVLDHAMRAASGGERCLDDLMRALFHGFALAGADYRFEDLDGVLSEVITAPELDGWFASHVAGSTPLPVLETLEAYGLRGLAKPYAGECFVVARASATPEQRAEWRWLTAERFR